MSNLFPAQITPDVSIVDGVPKTTSLAVADYFGKLHKNVLQAVKSLEYSEE